MHKRALIVAFHFPPHQGSSGIQRTLKFVKYLPEHGWEPIVLTAHPRAYPRKSQDQINDMPPGISVVQAFALDACRHLAIGSRYPKLLALPDRWSSWWLGAVTAGLQIIRRQRPAVLFTTYPIATAHLVGLTLNRLTGIPWIADFRDPMTDLDWPRDPTLYRVHEWLERTTLRNCRRAIVTTPGTLRMYAEKLPEVQQKKIRLIANGYDEENFSAAERLNSQHPRAAGPRVLVHSGILYPEERDPTAFFKALGELRHAGAIDSRALRIVLRATGYDRYLAELVQKNSIESIVQLAPPLPYEAALAEMLHADGLLLFQAASCNLQVPAKLYEYLRARRPILALTDPVGDTAATMREAGLDTIARIDSKDSIRTGLMRFLSLLDAGNAPIPDNQVIARYSRRARTAELATLFDEVSANQESFASAEV
jgi:glycosyltransferase involved in cell wall biosynthesis